MRVSASMSRRAWRTRLATELPKALAAETDPGSVLTAPSAASRPSASARTSSSRSCANSRCLLPLSMAPLVVRSSNASTPFLTP